MPDLQLPLRGVLKMIPKTIDFKAGFGWFLGSTPACFLKPPEPPKSTKDDTRTMSCTVRFFAKTSSTPSSFVYGIMFTSFQMTKHACNILQPNVPTRFVPGSGDSHGCLKGRSLSLPAIEKDWVRLFACSCGNHPFWVINTKFHGWDV